MDNRSYAAILFGMEIAITTAATLKEAQSNIEHDLVNQPHKLKFWKEAGHYLITINEPITSFTGDYDFLSNFFMREVYVGGTYYPSSEHAYQAAKTLIIDERKAIIAAATPGLAKRLGKLATLRPDWEETKKLWMYHIVSAKFIQHIDIQARLQATGTVELVEGNRWHDNIWGSCTCPACGNKGQNLLGKILMEIRETIP